MKPKATACAIVEKGGKVLLEKRNIEPYKGYWCLPGGHIDLYEKAEQAIIREIKEETGLDFNPRVFKYFDEIDEKINWHALVIVFTGEASGTEKPDPDEVEEMKWFEIKDAQKMKLAFIHNQVLNEYYGDE